MKNYFIVTSHGWSASNWVAHTLNLHPKITCTHSARNEWSNDKNLQSNENLKLNLKQLHQGYYLRQNRELDEAYDYIESLDDTSVYGSVHLYRLRDLPITAEKYGESSRSFNVVNLVRHPMSLVWSGYGQFKDLFRYDINELHWTSGKVLQQKDFLYYLAEKYNLYLGDFENLAFLGSCAVLGSLRLDIDALEPTKKLSSMNFKGIVRMEDVTSNPETLKDLITRLTDGKLTAVESYLDAAYSTGLINKHRQDNINLGPRERYESLHDWQKESFDFFVKLFDLKKPYEDMGYDLSFVK